MLICFTNIYDHIYIYKYVFTDAYKSVMLLFGEDIADTYKKNLDRKIRHDLQKAMEEDKQEELRNKKVSDSLKEEENQEKNYIKRTKNEKKKKNLKLKKMKK